MTSSTVPVGVVKKLREEIAALKEIANHQRIEINVLREENRRLNIYHCVHAPHDNMDWCMCGYLSNGK